MSRLLKRRRTPNQPLLASFAFGTAWAIGSAAHESIRRMRSVGTRCKRRTTRCRDEKVWPALTTKGRFSEGPKERYCTARTWFFEQDRNLSAGRLDRPERPTCSGGSSSLGRRNAQCRTPSFPSPSGNRDRPDTSRKSELRPMGRLRSRVSCHRQQSRNRNGPLRRHVEKRRLHAKRGKLGTSAVSSNNVPAAR
jgi:hypothetical protein